MAKALSQHTNNISLLHGLPYLAQSMLETLKDGKEGGGCAARFAFQHIGNKVFALICSVSLQSWARMIPQGTFVALFNGDIVPADSFC